MSSPTIYQLKIALEGTKPSIWRRVLVPSDIKLGTLHLAIQVSMGWSNAHLHQFFNRELEYYGPAELAADSEVKDESQIKLSQLLITEHDSIRYEYDFGDGWMHLILLEKILPIDSHKKLPYCSMSKRACPLEDCGGIWGYADLQKILADPQHEQHVEVTEILGSGFDPEYVNRRKINQLLFKHCQ